MNFFGKVKQFFGFDNTPNVEVNKNNQNMHQGSQQSSLENGNNINAVKVEGGGRRQRSKSLGRTNHRRRRNRRNHSHTRRNHLNRN